MPEQKFNFPKGLTVIPSGSGTPVINFDDHGNGYISGNLRLVGTLNVTTAVNATGTVTASGFIAGTSVGVTGTLGASSVATVVGGIIVSIT